MIVFALQAVCSDCLLRLLLLCSPMALVFPGDLLALPLCEAASAAAYDTRACADSRVRADGVAHGNACHVTGLLAVARCVVWATGFHGTAVTPSRSNRHCPEVSVGAVRHVR